MSMQRVQTLTTLLVLALAVLLGGCSGGDDDIVGELVPVTGVVKLDDKPLSGALVAFAATKGTKGTGATGRTDENGAFTLLKRSGKKGIEVGKYQCAVSKFARKDGTPFPPDTPGDVSAAEGMEHVPSRYVNGEASELIFEVPNGGKKFDIALTTKAPANAPSGIDAIMPK